MSDLTLYYTPGTCALAVRIALHEAGAAHQLVRLNLAQGEQRAPAYLAINPKGRVPALVTAHGVLTETPALLMYLAQRFAQARLAPLDDPWAMGRLHELHAYLSSTAHIAHAHGPRASRWADEPEAQAAMKRKVQANMADCAAFIEQYHLTSDAPWVLGEQYSVGDAYLFTVTGWMQGDGVELARYPRLQAHWQRVQARPAVQQALA